MSVTTDIHTAEEPATAKTGRRRRLALATAAVGLAAVGLFLAYLRMARAVPINADGGSNALQAYDILHGNPLLSGWTLSDVSFYTTELLQYALIQSVYGLNADMVHVAAAMTYVLIVALVAALAKGRATGAEAWFRIALALAIVLVPTPGVGYMTLLSSPNHTGTAVPMLLTWLVLDRATATRDGDARDRDARDGGARERRWRLPIAVALLLAWGEIGDPLVTFVGAVPLILVGAVRLLRADEPWARRWRGLDARLIVAALASVALAHGFLTAVRMAGGFHAPAPPISFAPVAALPDRVLATADMVVVIFGLDRPGWQPSPVESGLALIHLIGLVLAACAVIVVVARAVRDTSSDAADRVSQVLVIAIACNIGAEIVSTLPSDIMAAREISPVLPMAAALTGRVFGPYLSGIHPSGLRSRAASLGRPALAAVLATLTIALVFYQPPRAAPADNQDIAEWLEARGLGYGLGSFWTASNITVTTSRRVTVVPVGGTERLLPYCWQSKTDWYDPRHDARFVVFDLERPVYGTPEVAVKQFGEPAQRHDFGRYALLVYDFNLFDKLPPPCA